MRRWMSFESFVAGRILTSANIKWTEASNAPLRFVHWIKKVSFHAHEHCHRHKEKVNQSICCNSTQLGTDYILGRGRRFAQRIFLHKQTAEIIWRKNWAKTQSASSHWWASETEKLSRAQTKSLYSSELLLSQTVWNLSRGAEGTMTGQRTTRSRPEVVERRA